MRRRVLLCSVGLSIGLSTAAAGAERTFKNKYFNIEVIWFERAPGIDFPPDYLVATMEDIVAELQKTQTFKQVLRQGEKARIADAPTLRLTGVVTKYKKGSRRTRMFKRLVPWLAYGTPIGNTEITATIRFVDCATNAVVVERKMTGAIGKWAEGMAGGESIAATRTLAKNVAQLASERF